MNYNLINLQKAAFAAYQVYGMNHPITAKIRAELARVRETGEAPYLRSIKLNFPAKK